MSSAFQRQSGRFNALPRKRPGLFLIEIAKQADRQVPVHLLAIPAGDASLCMDMAIFEFLPEIDNDIVRRFRRPVAVLIDNPAHLVPEHDLPRIVPLAAKAAFVHQAVMLSAKLYQVV